MKNVGEESPERSAPNPPAFDHGLQPASASATGQRRPSQSSDLKRFIVEPQVLNAALELEAGSVTSPTTRPSTAPGGLPPPPRRPNLASGSSTGLLPPPRPISTSRKRKPSRSTPSSPPTSGEQSHLASFPDTPFSSSSNPNSPESVVSPAARSPRLSNFLGSDPPLFSTARRPSVVAQEEEEDEFGEERWQEPLPPSAWLSSSPERTKLRSSSPAASLTPSPEMSTTSVDKSGAGSGAGGAEGEARPSRQSRYLAGLQKIKSKSISMFSDASVRSRRRRSDADVETSRGGGLKKSESEDLSSRYRRMLDKGVRTAGELMKPSSSVPSSPITSPSSSSKKTERGGGGGPGSRAVATGSTSGSGSISQTTFHGFSWASSSRSGARVWSPSATAVGSPPGGAWASPPGAIAEQESSSRASAGPGVPSLAPSGAAAGANPSAAHAGSSALPQTSHGRPPSSAPPIMSAPSATSSLSPSAASREHPPSSYAEPRISISSTIYSSSFNNTSFDDTPRDPSSSPGRPAMSPDRESFIDMASPTFSPRAPEYQFVGIPPTSLRSHSEQSTPHARRSGESNIATPPSRPSSSPPVSTKPRLTSIIPPSHGPEKPPVPTAPKPDFSRRSLVGNKLSPVHPKRQSPMSSYPIGHDPAHPTFSFSNDLTPKERADLVRTTRKLAQVFGQPPGVPPTTHVPVQEVPVLPQGCLPGPLALNLNAKRKHHRPVVSMSDDVPNPPPVYDAAGALLWPPPEGTRYVSLAAHRRHSAPLSPDDYAFEPRKSSESVRSVASTDEPIIHIGPAHVAPASERSSTASSRRSKPGPPPPGSPMSFIDLSDEEGVNDGISDLLIETPKVSRGRRQPFSPTASFAETMSSDELAEEERRRKREKLAKLHRFLGSRVPPHLVLGPLDEGSPLPPPAPSPSSPADALPRSDDEGGDVRKVKMRRRRSSSAAEFSRGWSDDIDRLKQTLNEREKAINVRRAVKMEKMFGVAPPQTLYHTRAPTISTPNIAKDILRQSSPKPTSKTSRLGTTGTKSKGKRPGTGDSGNSAKPLIGSDSAFLKPGSSSVYMHYRHSLNSLNDILDRDDRESLAELHDYITGNGELYSTGEQYDYQFDTPGASGSSANPAHSPVSPLFGDDSSLPTPTTATAAAAKSERRRSLPSRVSIASFTSELSAVAAPPPSAFQQRRRRAAKLTHFFGVNYRDLMNEILESIEKGLEEDGRQGTLKPDEVKDLQQTLVTLKKKRNSLSQ